MTRPHGQTFIAPTHLLTDADPPALCGNGHRWSVTTSDVTAITCPLCLRTLTNMAIHDGVDPMVAAAMLTRTDLSEAQRWTWEEVLSAVWDA